MFMAERAGLPVVAKLVRHRIDLGNGARSIVPKAPPWRSTALRDISAFGETQRSPR
jgi:hypothetical protein